MKNGVIITPSIPPTASVPHNAKYFGERDVAIFKAKGFDVKENSTLSREKDAVWFSHEVISDATRQIEVTTSAVYIIYTDYPYGSGKNKFIFKIKGSNVEYRYLK